MISRLNTEAQCVRQGRTRLGDVLLLKGRRQDNSARTEYAMEKHRRLVVISELESWSAAAEAGKGTLPLGRFIENGMPFLNIDDARWQNTLKRFPREVAWWRKGGRVILTGVTDIPEQSGKYRRALVRQASLMMVSEQWIPLDSAFEGILADRLVRERRAFVKPLIYDSAENEYHPDFCLTDSPTGDICPVEVWGMDHDDYQQHRADKTMWYNIEFPRSWWSWDAIADPTGERMPSLPERSEYYRKKYPFPGA